MVRRVRWWAMHGVAVAVIGVSAAACGADPSDLAGPADGARVYAAKCASCHGTDLRGSSTGPTMLSEVYGPEAMTDDAFRAAISNGAPVRRWSFPAMAPVVGMSGAQVEAVIAYIRSIQRAEGLEPYPPG